MINFKDNDDAVQETEEEYDYTKEEPLDEELDDYDDEEKEAYTCD